MWFYLMTNEDKPIPISTESVSQPDFFYILADSTDDDGLVYVAF